MQMRNSNRRHQRGAGFGLVWCLRLIPVIGGLLLSLMAVPGFAASSTACQGGGFSVLGLSGEQKRIVLASNVGTSFLVKGKYVEFTVDAATFGVRDWTMTGAPNPLDITGGRRTVVFTAKVPDHGRLFLNSDVSVEISREALVIQRMGSGLSMKIQAKDCANGGIFQIEPARADGTATRFTHVLASDVFYFDNPNVRNRLGERIPCSGVLPDGTPVGEHARARDTFAQSVADVRIIEVEHVARQNMSETCRCPVGACRLNLEDTAVGAILGLDFHGQPRAHALNDQHFCGNFH